MKKRLKAEAKCIAVSFHTSYPFPPYPVRKIHDLKRQSLAVHTKAPPLSLLLDPSSAEPGDSNNPPVIPAPMFTAHVVHRNQPRGSSSCRLSHSQYALIARCFSIVSRRSIDAATGSRAAGATVGMGSVSSAMARSISARKSDSTLA